jgi:hypothetical protein
MYMKYKHTLILFIGITLCISSAHTQNMPLFGPEIKVMIQGLTFDAMEPFISPDGNTMFFNSLNDGINTRVHYATKIDDSTFIYIGEVNGVNEVNNPQLNAVASVDTAHRFVWVSTRNWPIVTENLHRGNYSNGTCTSTGRVYGNFYIYQPGWLIMDAAVTYNGSQLYYCNARFDTCVVPCEARLGIADRVNDSTFNTNVNAAYILQNVNDTNYLVYAPQLSANRLELYFTRLLIGSYNTEICVSVRSTTNDPFSAPMVLYADYPNFPEAATTDSAASLMYYHKKTNGTYALYLRYRSPLSVEENTPLAPFVFPNPAGDFIDVQIPNATETIVTLRDMKGCTVLQETNKTRINTSALAEGMYLLTAAFDNTVWHQKIQISR